MSATVFVTAPRLGESGVRALAESGSRVIYLPEGGGRAEVEEILAREAVDAVISRTVELSAGAIESCPSLRVITKHGVGVGNIDVEAATRRDIPVLTTPGANAQSVAELTIALMFTAARRVSWMDAEIRQGRWSRAQDGRQLAGATLGLVGAGQIGQRVARTAAATGMRVLAFDPGFGLDAPSPELTMVGSLEELLGQADVLSLHVPLSERTRGLIGAAQLALLPTDAIVLNTARGEIVDEPALVDALRSGRLFAAGLDTTWAEPIEPGNPLLTCPNVVITPHVGGSTPAALEAMALAAARNVLGYLDGAIPDVRSCVNPTTLSAERSTA
ncbi:hydroxyacid dehydrogenase [Pseudoclavibacter sp. VKM Ac-2867]|uniref:hydroxyacid dehydrogenase n=1 Tax=Pseudoclavibacter sp. VKM Ac-2867 TaxID=2783829 RepID=UPI00188D0554|nr:hydroxyacid dehydrogenase [Pseudoclavibacter sp. VKM Ac-2867]MBF4459764.1 hydroxyacid dehydrogenase [Pseudoclavibacter sp. VKM Ac-2867]